MRRLSAFLLVVALAVHACAQATGGQGSPVLLPVDEHSFAQIRTAAKGKVLVLNFWATWCKPCLEEFPHLVKLQKHYEAQGLDVMFISVDDDDAKTTRRVRSVLATMGVEKPSYLKKSRNDEGFINAVHPSWSGAVPTTFVYDRNGKLIAMRSEEMGFDDLEKIVVPLLR
mgnify:FL=1